MRTRRFFIIIVGLAVFLMSACQSNRNLALSVDAEKQTIKVIENDNTDKSADASQEQESVVQLEEDIYYNTYNVSIDVNPYSREIEGLENVTYKNNTGKSLKYLYFHTYAKAFEKESTKKPYTEEYEKEIFKYGQDYSTFEIKTVYVNNKEINFKQNNSILVLELENELKENEETTITIHFKGYIPQISHRMGSNKNAIWIGNFLPVLCKYDIQGWRTEAYYPVGEPFYSDIAKYNVTITTPKGYAVVGTGTQTFTEDNNKRVTTLGAQLVRDFAFCVSNKYNVLTYKTNNNVNINFWYYSKDLEIEIDLITVAKEFVEYYGSKFGSYPYEELDLVETDLFSEAAQSYPAFIMLDTDSIKSDSFEEELALGIGKQWLGNIIGIDYINNAWLREGFSTYLQQKWYYLQNNIEIDTIK